MDIFYSELCLIGGEPELNVAKMRDAGGCNIELMLDGAGWEGFATRIEELAHRLSGCGVCYSVHTPVWEANLTSRNSFIREGVLEGYRQTIRLAARLGAGQVVVHPGFCSVAGDDKVALKKIMREQLDRLFEFNRDYGIQLLIENVGSNATSLFTMEEYIDFCKGLPPEGGALLDIGHAHINGWDMARLISGVADRLCALHLHDNSGNADQHLPIGEGTVDWAALARILAGTAAKPHLVLEYDIGTDLHRLAEGKRYLEQHFI